MTQMTQMDADNFSLIDLGREGSKLPDHAFESQSFGTEIEE